MFKSHLLSRASQLKKPKNRKNLTSLSSVLEKVIKKTDSEISIKFFQFPPTSSKPVQLSLMSKIVFTPGIFKSYNLLPINTTSNHQF